METFERPNQPALAPPISMDVAEDAGNDMDSVVARGYWEQAWRRMKKDRVAMWSLYTLIVMFAIIFLGAPIAQHFLGHGPNTIIPGGVGLQSFEPVGPWSRVDAGGGKTTLLILGGSDLTGRDEFLRLLYGGQVSIEVGVFSTIFGMTLGVITGMIAGYYGGHADTLVSRLIDIVMCFPLLLFLIALSATLGDRINSITLGGAFYPGVVTLTLVLTLFSWFYPARIFRGVILSLREREFIEAARMTGASNFRIMRTHLLPHLTGLIIIYSTLSIAVNILAESTLSFLGVGLPPPNPSWGNLLDQASSLYQAAPLLIVWPGLMLLILALAFNLLGDGLQDALDPRAEL
jgi:peptide/nickel transport system permease protein